MRSLLWKEWHEQRWKLAFGSLILAAFAFIGLHARVVADEMLLDWVCFLAVALLPVLASTGLVPAERDDGTLETLFSLPVEPRRIFVMKSTMGVLLTAGPLVAAAIVSLSMASGREMSAGSMILLFLESLAAALSLFFWMFALTVRLPTETRASLIAMAVLIMWLIVALGLAGSSESVLFHNPMAPLDKPAAPSALWVVCPFLFLIPPGNAGAPMILGAVFIQAAIAALLMLWASRRFSQLASAEGLR